VLKLNLEKEELIPQRKQEAQLEVVDSG
jgi:hypothetical protein